MNDDRSSIPDNLRAKFPELRPIRGTPALVRINGIGLGMYGKRDFDAESGTYIKTHCICFLFVPLMALAAYRVADAERGWYFLGKERLSSFAKSCNVGVLLLSLMLAGILAESAYKSSPEFQARQTLQRAAETLQAGNPVRAAQLYREVAEGRARATEGWNGLRAALESCLTNDAPDKVEAGFRLLTALPPRLNSPEPVVPNAYQRGQAAIERFRAANPEAAVAILRQVAPLGGRTNTALRPAEIELLKSVLAANPDNTNRLVELALIYEEQKQLPESWQLLTPHRGKLGSTEGARILGQHLLEEGQYDEAYGLLYPYVQSRLEKLRAIERNYTNAFAASFHRAITHLKEGQADRSFYDAYDKASKAEKEAMVDAFTEKWMRQDAAFQRAVAELQAANRVVHVTLDLGIVQLNRARALADPAARKAELEAAEKTFLAIRGLAGDTDEYRMFLGQVYYWLGRAGEGRELFDQLLAAHKRSYPVLMALGNKLREVGDETQARGLIEEAYRTATKEADKFSAASLRAHTSKDVDDEIAWFDKSDPNEPATQIGLNSARGNRALQEGRRDEAAQFLRRAIAGYQGLPQGSANCNNCGLVYLSLYQITGDVQDYNRGLALLEQAISLEPGSSLLRLNITHLLLTRACMDVVGDAIHFGALKKSPDLALLAYLCRDEPGRVAIAQRLRQDEYLQKALTHLDKALLLAPKHASLYRIGLHLQVWFRDLPELQKLQQRLQLAAPDVAEARQDAKEAYDGAKDQQRLDRVQVEIRRYEALLQDSAVKDHPPTLACAEVELNSLRQQARACGAAVDSTKLLADAYAAHQRQPTGASRGALISACFFRAHDELKQQDAPYAQLAETTRRSLPPRELMALLLEQNAPAAALIRNNANVLKALQLVKEQARLFPSWGEVDEWALFGSIEPAEAARVLSQLKEDKVGRVADELQLQLHPLSATAVLDQYWTRKMTGDKPGATQLYQKALSEGVPLPPL